MSDGKKRSLGPWVMLAVLTACVLVVAFGVYIAWSITSGLMNAERQALAEARVLNAEASAAWEYVSSIEDRVNYTHGEYDFKGVYCTIAAKDIARRFSDSSTYSIRYVRDNPRNVADAPDDFEQRALAAFAQGDDEYYERPAPQEGSDGMFRYASALFIEGSCLKCHGEVAGEKDPVGYLKEGMALGDLAGAVSIEIPMAGLLAQMTGDIVRAAVLFVALMVGLALVGLWGTRHFVAHPLVEENARLEGEGQAQSNFLTIMSHELKTPVASIMAFTELWKRAGVPRTVEEERLVDEVQMNSKVLLDMVDNVLDTARLEAGALRVDMGPVDIVDVASLVRSTMGPIAQNRGVEFAVKIEPGVPVIMTDREAVRRITVNLVNNALRYSPRGGSVRLSFGYAGGCLDIGVVDTGIGIAPDQVENIFERFVSSEGSAGTSQGGSGLGLYIVRGFAERMGGHTEVKSEPGKGSEFHVYLPAVACPDGDGEE